MTEFSAAARRAAYEEPVLRYGRFVYRGRVLSAEEWFPFWDEYLDLVDAAKAMSNAAEPQLKELAALERRSHDLRLRYLRTVFPTGRFRFWAPDPIAQLQRAHPQEMRDAFHAFFSLQARAMGLAEPKIESPQTPPTTDGTSSNASTRAESS